MLCPFVTGEADGGGRYDTTGRTTESTGGMFDDAASMGSWEAYFAAVYQKVDKKMLDEDRERYQGAPPLSGLLSIR